MAAAAIRKLNDGIDPFFERCGWLQIVAPLENRLSCALLGLREFGFHSVMADPKEKR